MTGEGHQGTVQGDGDFPSCPGLHTDVCICKKESHGTLTIYVVDCMQVLHKESKGILKSS